MRLLVRAVTLICLISSAAYAAFLPFISIAEGNYFNQVFTNNGTSQFMFNSWFALLWELSSGTAGAPVAVSGPLLKISKTENVAKATCNNNQADSECNSALLVEVNAATSSQMQPTAGAFYANSASTYSAANGSVAIISIGRIFGSGIGAGQGAYIEGRTDTSTAVETGAEIRSTNQVASNAQSFFSGGYTPGGLWVTAGGLSKSGCGICIGTAGQPFDVGFGVTAASVASWAFKSPGFAVDSSGNVAALGYSAGSSSGVSCSGAPTASFTSINGIVTHC